MGNLRTQEVVQCAWDWSRLVAVMEGVCFAGDECDVERLAT
jgi:hypothetical protein